MEETHHQATSATCPRCAQTLRQLRVGRNRSGSQRYLCSFCQRKYTPHPQVHGYDAALRRQANEWSVDGMNLRRIAAISASSTKQSRTGWRPMPRRRRMRRPSRPAIRSSPCCRLWSWTNSTRLRGKKKQRIYLITQVDRASRCVIAYDGAADCEPTRRQALLNHAPSARQYYSDQLAAYTNLVYYPGQHVALPNKSQTYSVEGDNAEFRHYLARLARLARRSRCFTRLLHALRDAIKLFVFAWNHRQLFRQAHPTYPAHVFQFAYPPS